MNTIFTFSPFLLESKSKWRGFVAILEPIIAEVIPWLLLTTKKKTNRKREILKLMTTNHVTFIV